MNSINRKSSKSINILEDKFINNILLLRARHLAFYLFINGFVNIQKFNYKIFMKYFNNLGSINYLIIQYLKNKKDIQFSKDISIYSILSSSFNYNYNNINYYNYGFEGILFELINKINLIKYEDKDYLDNLENLYVNNIKNAIKNKVDEKKTYNLFNYINKIFCDIIIYCYIYTNINIDIFLNSEIVENIRKKFLEYFIAEHNKIYKNFYLEENKKKFLDKFYNKYNKLLEIDNSVSDSLNNNNDIILLQQYYNLFIYGYKYIEEHKSLITYFNTIILNFKNLPLDIYNNDLMNAKEIQNIIKKVIENKE